MSTVFTLYRGVVALDVFGAFDALSQADAFLIQQGRAPHFRPLLAALDERPVRVASGPRILPDQCLADTQPSTVVIPGGVRTSCAEERAQLARFVRSLPPNVRLIGICTGAFILADAGVLAGRRATTHWGAMGTLAKRHPDVDLIPDALYVNDGRIWTSAGVTAGIDLALALIRKELGAELSLKVARELVVFAHRPGGQSQFSAQLSAQTTESDMLYEVQQYVLGHLCADLRVPTLAARAHMSPRNFARQFVQQTGMTPGQFVQRARLDAARTLLESTQFGLTDVAERCGLPSEEALRRLFRRHLDTSPGVYRACFRTTGERPSTL